jgi:colicin import membrane protein
VQHDALLPRPPGGLAPGVALSLLVHAGLLVALTLAVDWRMKAPEIVSAELWSAVPQVATPKVEAPPAPAPAPPPPAPAPAPAPPPREAAPREPDIAVSRAERRKLEREQKAEAEKALAEKKKREDAEAAAEKQRLAEQQKAEEVRLAKARDEQMKRMLGALPTAGTSNGTASQDSAPSQAYIGRLRKAVRDSIRFSVEGLSGNPVAEVEVRATPSGTIISSRLATSSGVAEWDKAVMRGIGSMSSLPPPRANEGRIPDPLILELRPKE